MESDTNDGAAYLMALKRVGRTAADAAEAIPPANESSAADAVDAKFSGAEKRRSTRYQCSGSARICQDGSDVATWATFTDVSLHGCYVEAQATYPAGTPLQMKLEANGIRLETKGTVRVSYPYLGMGIAFTDMTQENIAELKRLLGTLSRHSILAGPGLASSIPAADVLKAVALTNPQAAIQGILDYFETRQVLMRDEFVKILQKSQGNAEGRS